MVIEMLVNLKAPSLENVASKKTEVKVLKDSFKKAMENTNDNNRNSVVSEDEPKIISTLKEVISSVKKQSEQITDLEVKAEVDSLTEDLISLVGILNELISIEDTNDVNLEISFDELIGAEFIKSNKDSITNTVIELDEGKFSNAINQLGTVIESIEKALNSESIIKNIDVSLLQEIDTEIAPLVALLEKNEGKLKPKDFKELFATTEKTNNMLEKNINNIQKVSVVETSKFDFSESDNSSENKGFTQNEEAKILAKDSALESTTDSTEDSILSRILGEDKFAQKLEVVSERFGIQKVDVPKEPQAMTKWSIGEDMITNVKFMVKNSVTELSLKVYPKELGEVTIKLLSEDGIIKADLKAVSKETYHLLNNNIHDIKKSLENQGIKIQSVEIGLYSEDTTYFSNGQGFNGQGSENDRGFSSFNAGLNSSEAEIEEVKEESLNSNLDYLV